MAIRLITALIGASLACTAMGEMKFYQTRILQTASLQAERGGCMAKLANPPSEYGLLCDGAWVHFSCNGAINSQTEGLSKLEAAQLGLVTGSSVKIQVDDSIEKKIWNNCYAPRIDNLSE